MARNKLNTNRQFMIGNGLLAFAVLAVILLFTYMSFRFQRVPGQGGEAREGIYVVSLSANFAGDSLSLWLNDSLLVRRVMPDTILRLEVGCFAKESVLKVETEREGTVAAFPLSPRGSRVELRKEEDGGVAMTERP